MAGWRMWEKTGHLAVNKKVIADVEVLGRVTGPSPASPCPVSLCTEGREGKLSWCRGRKCLRGRARAGAKGRILCDQGVWAEQGEGQGFSPE